MPCDYFRYKLFYKLIELYRLLKKQNSNIIFNIIKYAFKLLKNKVRDKYGKKI
jgi:hypothetical protein